MPPVSIMHGITYGINLFFDFYIFLLYPVFLSFWKMPVYRCFRPSSLIKSVWRRRYWQKTSTAKFSA